jgi:hypothetical protein
MDTQAGPEDFGALDIERHGQHRPEIFEWRWQAAAA